MVFLSRTTSSFCARTIVFSRQSQRRSFQTVARSRRLRPVFDKASTAAGQSFPKPSAAGGSSSSAQQTGPHGLSTKSTLSPWVPLPDAVARKALDMADAGSEDIHVDLGSGDGRVNFHALDGFRVKSSIGIEVDEDLIRAANERLMKRHPRPPNLEFKMADLLASMDDPVDNVWLRVIPHATIITFYFAKPEMIRSRLEAALTGKRCKIVSCGYEMPGWDAAQEQVVLGTTIYLYDFGGDHSTFRGEDLVTSDVISANATIAAFQQQQNLGKKFAGANVVDRTGHFPIRGFDPDSIHNDEEDDDDEDWDAVLDNDTTKKGDDVVIEKNNSTTPKTAGRCGKKKE